jgi:membrane-anchored protein YejM (alkaline phosphatase superfamily)
MQAVTMYYFFIKDFFNIVSSISRTFGYQLLIYFVSSVLTSTLFLIENFHFFRTDIKTSIRASTFRSNTYLSIIAVFSIFAIIYAYLYPRPYFNILEKSPIITFIDSAIRTAVKATAPDNQYNLMQKKNQYLQSLHDLHSNNQKPANVIIIVIESLRSDLMYTNEYINSPVLKKMLNKGGFFVENMYAQSSETVASLKAIFTGIYPYKIKFFNSCILLQDIFKTIGYKTSFFTSTKIKWANMQDIIDLNIDHFKEIKDNNIKDRDSSIIDEMESWISNNMQNPFFAFLLLNNTHFLFRTNYFSESVEANKLSGIEKDKLIYKTAVADSIEKISQIYNFLESKKLSDNTILIITSDHGEDFLEHGLLFHANNLHRESISIPLFVFYPHIKTNTKEINYGRHVDIIPTILSLLDMPAPCNLDGINLLSDINKSNFSTVSWLFHNGQISICTEKYHYLKNMYFRDESELYNLEKDPFEQSDIKHSNKQVCDFFEEYIKKNVEPYF